MKFFNIILNLIYFKDLYPCGLYFFIIKILRLVFFKTIKVLLYNFVKGGNDKLPQHKCENMFIQMLEGLQENEADVLILTKDKKLHQKFKGLSKQVVQQAFSWDEQFFDTTHKDYKKSA